MSLPKELQAYLDDCYEEELQLIRDMAVIPAPSHHEEKRAEFCKAWFEKNGFENVFIDEALNVIAPYGVTDSNKLFVFSAHTDTVFPDTDPLPLKEDGENIYCPGIGDDTANLVSMMIAARYFVQKHRTPKCGILFVANSCEEGLGNLKGIRAIAAKYGDRMLGHISFDGAMKNRVVTSAVGSTRYEVTVRTEGGHSFQKFGNRNAIRYLAEVISAIYQIKVPELDGSRTSYNVGTVSGGTSVNTIAQEAKMLCEYRSNNRECLEKMKTAFLGIFEAYRAMGIDLTYEVVGDRPCCGDVDPDAYAALIAMADDGIRDLFGVEPVHGASSTDCNIPLSLGIPSICLTGAAGSGAHTRGEYINKQGMKDGMKVAAFAIGTRFE